MLPTPQLFSFQDFKSRKKPQFVNHGEDGTANGLVYAGCGDSCQWMIRENRECVTIHPFASFDGKIGMYHVILIGKDISGQMVPESAVEKIPNLLISTYDSGSQDHKTLLAAYSKFDQYLETNNLKCPIWKINLFSQSMTINRKSFMLILANLWES